MPVPVTTNFVAAPGLTVMLELVAAVPLAGVNVNVPDPDVPVNFKPKLVKFATPLLKSPAWFNTLLTPLPKPLIVPVNVLLTGTLFPEALKLVTVLP